MEKNRIEKKRSDKFRSLVSDGKYFDVKDNIKQTLQSSKIKLGSYWYEYSTSGNIMYGFYGAAAGYDLDMLHAGAGFAQANDFIHAPSSGLGSPFRFFDTKGDYYAVEFGFQLYTDYYLPDGDLTQAEFTQALDNYDNRKKLDREKDAPCVGAKEKYATDQFYNK